MLYNNSVVVVLLFRVSNARNVWPFGRFYDRMRYLSYRALYSKKKEKRKSRLSNNIFVYLFILQEIINHLHAWQKYSAFESVKAIVGMLSQTW